MSSALVVGEALVDVVRTPDGSVREHPGGSPANVALGLARLGRPTHLLTALADDPHGRLVADHLQGSGVQLLGTGSAARVPMTSVAQATLDAEGAATYTFDIDWDLPDVDLPADAVVVHTGSIGAMLEPGAAAVARIMQDARAGATTTYDPNLRPALLPQDRTAVRAAVEAMVARCDVVKASDEDLAWLEPGVDPVEVLERWLALGPAVVALTRGGEGATALCAAGRVDTGAHATTVVDTVGAGDSFMAGLLDRLWSEDLLGADRREALRGISTETLQRIVHRAAAAAAVTVARPGADLPTAADLG